MGCMFFFLEFQNAIHSLSYLFVSMRAFCGTWVGLDDNKREWGPSIGIRGLGITLGPNL